MSVAQSKRASFDLGTWIIPMIAVIIAMVIAGIMMKLQGAEPLSAYKTLFTTSFGSVKGFSATLGKATPLVLAGLAVTIGLRAGLFNIGAQGQLISGALGTAWAGYSLTGLPAYIHLPIAIAFGIFFGGFVGFIAGALKAYRGVHEVITTIMLNSIIMGVTDYLVVHHFREPGQLLTRTSEIQNSARLPIIFNLPFGFFIAIGLAGVAWWIMSNTTSGFKFETVGRNKFAAWYAGISVKRTLMSAMMISGGIAGLGGAVETLGVTYRFEPSFNLGLGFDGITIALLGRAHPLGIIPGAILIGGMRAGASNMQFVAGVATELVDLLMALVLFFVTAPLVTRFFKNAGTKAVTGGWGN